MKGATCTYRRFVERGHGTLFYLLCLLCLIPLATALCAITVFAMKASRPPQYTSRRGTPCCEEQVTLLSTVVNPNINPCKSAYDFTCHRYSAEAAPGALLDAPTIANSWGYRPSTTAAGKLAYQYFRSCVTAAVKGERLGAQTASTLLELLAPSVKFPLRLFVEMSLKYSILLPVSFLCENAYHSWSYPLPRRQFFNVYHIAVAHTPVHLPFLSKEAKETYHRIRLDARRRINTHLSLNISEAELEELSAALRVAPRPAYIASNLTALSNLIPELTVAQWRELLENAAGSNISGVVYLNPNMGALKRSLDIMLDPNTEGKSVVFSLVEAASSLLISAVLEKDNRDMRKRYFSSCEDRSSSIVGPLLIVDVLQTLKASKLQDVMLRTYFRSIVKAVRERATILVAPEDAESMRKYLQQISLVLPSEVFRLDFLLPTLTNEYARNYLVMRDSRWTLYDIPVPHDVPRLEILKTTLGWKPAVFNSVVILPLSAYAAVNITPDLDAVVPLGTLGMLMADAVWRIVLGFRWSNATTHRLRDYYVCITEEKRIRRQARFFYPSLSLDAALDAARRKHWNSPLKFYAHELQRTSRSRLFFLLILFHYYCPIANYASPLYRRGEANYLLLRSDDFRQAFGCKGKPASSDVRRC